MLRVSVQAASRGVALVINNSIVVSTLTAGQIVRHQQILKIAIGGEFLFSHHMGAQMPQVRQHLSIRNLATLVVDRGHGLLAIRHHQAMVIPPAARSTNRPLAAVVPDLALALPHQSTQEHDLVVTLLRMDKYRKSRIFITGTHRRHLRRRRPTLLHHVHP
jgi:hypothetical protein